MIPHEVCIQLLALGRSDDFAAVGALPGSGVHAVVCRLADVHRDVVRQFFHSLAAEDHAPFLMALAVYEDSVNGLGSVTLLRDLLPEAHDPDNELLDWILRNTKSYWYYSHGARSIEEYIAQCKWRADRTAANIQRDEARQALDRIRIAHQSSAKLYNAVRRGDLKAVEALLGKGAEPKSTTSEGESLMSFAERIARPDIAMALRAAAQSAV